MAIPTVRSSVASRAMIETRMMASSPDWTTELREEAPAVLIQLGIEGGQDPEARTDLGARLPQARSPPGPVDVRNGGDERPAEAIAHHVEGVREVLVDPH